MIAITLLSFLMMGVYFITDNSVTTKDMVTLQDNDKLQIESAFSRIQSDFSLIYSPLFFTEIKKNKNGKDSDTATYETNKKFPAVSKNGLPIPVIENEKSDLIFLTCANKRKRANSKQSNYAWVYYKLRANTDENANAKAPNELTRYFLPEDPYSKEFNFDKYKPAVLLKNIVDMEISFWSKKNEKFESSLESIDNKLFLQSIKIVIENMDSKGLVNKYERIFRAIHPYYDSSDDDVDTKKKNIHNINNNINNNEENNTDGEDY